MFILVNAVTGRSLDLPAYRDRKAAHAAASALGRVGGDAVAVRSTDRR